MGKKHFFACLFGVVLLVFLYFGWKFYQNTTRLIIPISDLTSVTVKKENGHLLLTGNAKLNQFERVSNYGAVQIDDILYIYVMKTKSIIKSDSVNEDITNITISDSSNPPKKIYLVSGTNIEVKYKDRPEMNYIDVTKYSEKKELAIPE